MSDTIDSERIAKDIIFLESDSSRGSWDVEEWEAKVLSRYPVLQERVATAAGWIQMLIAEAVAAERERCCAAICNICAGMRPEYGPAVLESSPLGTTQPWWQHPHLSGDPWKAVPCDADDIRTRAGEGEQG